MVLPIERNLNTTRQHESSNENGVEQLPICLWLKILTMKTNLRPNSWWEPRFQINKILKHDVILFFVPFSNMINIRMWVLVIYWLWYDFGSKHCHIWLILDFFTEYFNKHKLYNCLFIIIIKKHYVFHISSLLYIILLEIHHLPFHHI